MRDTDFPPESRRLLERGYCMDVLLTGVPKKEFMRRFGLSEYMYRYIITIHRLSDAEKMKIRVERARTLKGRMVT